MQKWTSAEKLKGIIDNYLESGRGIDGQRIEMGIGRQVIQIDSRHSEKRTRGGKRESRRIVEKTIR